MAYMHIGKDFVPPDVAGKVTGRIKYAEDYTREGMVYARLLTSPIPHARVVNIDASEALAMEGVHGILTADEVYPDGEPQSTGLKILTNEPTLVGEPILALAAVDEKTAETAIAALNVTFERLPFVLDPLDSLREGGPNAYANGNTFNREGYGEVKWTTDQVASFRAAGGGFGQRARANSIPSMAIPAKMAQKLNRPVMMRITREEEFTIGGARQGFQGWIKVGFRPDGVMSACDLFIVSDDGGKGGGADAYSAADCISILYQTEAVRYRNASVATNTAHRGAQRGPGQNQIAPIIAPIMDAAADALGMSRLDIRVVNSAQTGDVGGPQRTPLTSAYMPEALRQTAEAFDWEARQSRRRQRNGNKVIGLGIGQGYHAAGRSGQDGIVMMGADGRLKIHSGVGNLGTYSYAATSRAAAEALRMPWESCDIITGRTDNHLPITSPQDGSNSIFTNTRTCYGAAMDLVAKMKEIAAADLGGEPADYDISEERVHQIADSGTGMTYAEVAQRAMELGGKYTGEAELPEDLHEWTQIAASRLAGTAFMGIYHDPVISNNPPGFTVTCTEIELDLETGKFDILDMVSVGECGTVVHPQGLKNQLVGGAVWGIGLSALERHLYDPQNGLPASTGYWQSKVPTYLDTPVKIDAGWVDLPDPENPVGARGIGEPSQGSVSAALTAAISDALDGHIFGAAPITTDMIINHIAGTREDAVALAQNNFRG